MSRIRSADTSPEKKVRSLAHRLGFRFRLHVRELPGKPDLVFPRLKKIIFVHGCFWHQHRGCIDGRLPASRIEYWGPKLAANRARDTKHRRVLKKLDWRVLVVWECETANEKRLRATLQRFLCGSA